jgi:death-on-curing family protein
MAEDTQPIQGQPKEPPPIIARLTMDDLRLAHGVLAEVFETDPEPLPAWGQGNYRALATCRGCIEVEAFEVQKYPDLPSAAAKLFYSTIKLHPFPNGNKRFALVLTLLFIAKNGYRLTAAQGVGAGVAKVVAAADPHDPATAPDVVIAVLAELYADNIEKRDGVLGPN